MRWDQINHQTCSISRSLAIFGDTWTLLIIRQIFMRIRRFSDIQQSLGITKHRLTDRLNRLIEAEVIYKSLYDEKYQRYEYRLTEKGLDISPILMTITMWGDKWLADADGAPVEYVHKQCGHNAKPVLACSACGESLSARDAELHLGPGIAQKLERGQLSELDIKLYQGAFFTAGAVKK